MNIVNKKLGLIFAFWFSLALLIGAITPAALAARLSSQPMIDAVYGVMPPLFATPEGQQLASGQRVTLASDAYVVLDSASDPARLTYDPVSQAIHLHSDGNLQLTELRGLGDVTITADTITLRDSPTEPVLIVAHGNLLLDADLIDIFTLNHPESWLVSGGDMIFRSPQATRGDAHYSAGGNIRFETREGLPGALYSPDDPILFAQGNVQIASYTGASLHILAGGNITVPGTINVGFPVSGIGLPGTIRPANNDLFNGVDPISALAPITLTNGYTLTVDGSARATLDLRAGIDWNSFPGGPPLNEWRAPGFTPPGATHSLPTGANITVGTIVISNNNRGLVLLTNQYRPRANATGNISAGNISSTASTNFQWNGGEVIADSSGVVSLGNINTISNATPAPQILGSGGDVLLLGAGNIQTGNISTFGPATPGFARGGGGNVTIESANGDVGFGQINTGIFSGDVFTTTEPAGDVTITALNGQIGSTAVSINAYSWSNNAGSTLSGGGNVSLTAGQGFDWPTNFAIRTEAFSNGALTGRSGDVSLWAGQGDIVLGQIFAYSSARTSSVPGSGQISVVAANGAAQFSSPNSLLAYAETFAPIGSVTADTGAIVITATQGITVNNIVRNEATAVAGPNSVANSGPISLHTSAGPIFIGSFINNILVGRDATGNVGGVSLTALNGGIVVGGTISTGNSTSNANGQAGRGGDIIVSASGDIWLNNTAATGGSAGSGGFKDDTGHISVTSDSGDIAVNMLRTDIGTSNAITTTQTGDITVLALNGAITLNSASMLTSNRVSNVGGSAGSAGNITLRAEQGIFTPVNLVVDTRVDGSGRAPGRGGDILMETAQGNLILGTALTNNSSATIDDIGGSGNVTLHTGDGVVHLTNGSFGVAAYAYTLVPNGGSVTADTGSITITATQGITVNSTLRNEAVAVAGPNSVAGSGPISLYTSSGPIVVNGLINNSLTGRDNSGDAGGVTLTAVNDSISLGGIGTTSSASNPNGQAGRGGDVILDAGGDIQINNISTGGTAGDGGFKDGSGHIALTSATGNIIALSTLATDIFTSNAITTTQTGNITLLALDGAITLGATSIRTTNSVNNAGGTAGPAGNITLRAGLGVNTDPSLTVDTRSSSIGQSPHRSGDVLIETAQGDLILQQVWTNNSAATIGDSGSSGNVTLITGDGVVQLTGGSFGVAAYAYTLVPDGGSVTADTGSITITATQGITINHSLRNEAVAVAGPNSVAGSGPISLYTSSGPIVVGFINNNLLGRGSSGDAGGVNLTAPNGDVTIGGALNTSSTANNVNGQAGRGGDITVSAGGDVWLNSFSPTGSVGDGGTHAGGGHLSLTSANGDVTVAAAGALPTGFNTSNAITSGPAGDFSLIAPNGQVRLPNLTLLSTANSSSNPASTVGAGGNVWLQAGTGFVWSPTFRIWASTYTVDGATNGRSGDVHIATDAGDIDLFYIWSHGVTNSGDMAGSGAISVTTGDGFVRLNDSSGLSSYVRSINGNTGITGNIVVTATQGITISGNVWHHNAVDSLGAEAGDRGDFRLYTSGGNITVGAINAYVNGQASSGDGGGVILTAPNGAITVNGLIDGRNNAPNANGQAGRGATVRLNALGDIETATIHVGGTTGSGGAHAGAGHIQLQTPADIRTANLTANLSPATAGSGGAIALSGDTVRVDGLVQAIGLSGTGGITITHGGNGVVPFVVGDSAVNGSTGQLRTADAQINPTNSFLFTHLEPPNIWIISVDQPIDGLTAENSSPTTLGQTTFFTATVSAGNMVSYLWEFGDGNGGTGALPNHVYGAVGTYTATVTATNPLNSQVVATVVTITNDAPVADGGGNQTVPVSSLVTLDGSGSTDPDDHLPLTYGWTQTGGPAVALSDPTAVMPTFTAPTLPTVITFTLTVTDSFGLASLPDTVVITVEDVAVSGLNATNSSPTTLGQTTGFTATVSAGSNVSYAWAFGDGNGGAGALVNHLYGAAGVYTAVVTATNQSGVLTATTVVTITNLAPIANAGLDQTVEVNDPVTLDGSGSSDPDGHLPLTYGWVQTGGPGVSLSDPTAAQPTFTALGTPTVLTFTLIVTDSFGLASLPDEVVVTVEDAGIAGLTAENSSPTVLGQTTFFTATVSAGNMVSYLWEFGDGNGGAGALVNHLYGAAGVYTAVVTATNQTSVITATTTVTITNLPVTTIYLPLITNNFVAAPDLVVHELIVDENGVTVIIGNVGNTAVINPFWVDVYFDPDPPPTAVNQTWQMLGEEGLVWGVTTPILPGQTLTLTIADASFVPAESNFSGTIGAGTAVYAQVDSAAAGSDYGAILELHEILGLPYNNIVGPVLVSDTIALPLVPYQFQQSGGSLPPRPDLR